MKAAHLYCTFFILLILSGCASYKLQYKDNDKEQKWKAIELPQDQKPYYTFFLIGDAGYAPSGKSTPLFDHLKGVLSRAESQSTAIWLGDNIYPVGLAPESHEDHALGYHRITAQLKTVLEFPGKVHFIPGNHDWYEWGQEGIVRQEKLVESFLQENKKIQPQEKDSYFIPSNGCGGPVAVEVNKDLVYIAIDSHWYLKSRYNRSTSKEHCEVKTHMDYYNTLKDLFKAHKEKTILLTSHHPPFTYGKHGGFYQTKYYFFPLTQVSNSLIVPLPFSGTIANLARPYISEQDTKHPRYIRYRDEIMSWATAHGRTIVASGHEHNLQYITRSGVPFIVSGSGSKTAEVTLGEGSEFGIGNYGYATLQLYSDGQSIIRYYTMIDDEVQEVFRAIPWK
jgi:hypothetical protein